MCNISLINNRIAPSSLGNRASEVGSNGWDRQFGAIGESWYAGIHPPGSPGSKKRINGFWRLSLYCHVVVVFISGLRFVHDSFRDTEKKNFNDWLMYINNNDLIDVDKVTTLDLSLFR